jgi:hypothetical protein
MAIVSKPVNQATQFKVLFVGLVCFLTDRTGSRPVLLPDGRDPGGEVEPHFPYIVVNPDAVIDRDGWETDDAEVSGFMQRGFFRLPQCTLNISGVDGKGPFDHAQHDGGVPSLIGADPRAQISRSPKAVVKLTISSGKLEAFRRPVQDDVDLQNDDVAVVSRLTVDYEDDIVIGVDGAGGRRMLRLKPGTELAIANIALPPDTERHGSHFQIYAKLLTRSSLREQAQRVSRTVSPLPSDHFIFTSGRFGVNDGTARCGNQGCC